ncbi:hypothetical protein ECG_01026 [Echinococcus granulosus]|uniref:Uncharacterized protein n=1 Tax=Echinococcus granulosus TaxID=6210 RepID=A0A068W8Y0_ECHGR|nr:hypothetical protein ECG_01026 [Echinococcus granulosus]CDS16078.1 hypothetical protein EgrG_002017900 [Echinococcus granulosus]
MNKYIFNDVNPNTSGLRDFSLRKDHHNHLRLRLSFHGLILKYPQLLLGYDDTETTASHSAANALVKRFHCHLKPVIMANSGVRWTELESTALSEICSTSTDSDIGFTSYTSCRTNHAPAKLRPSSHTSSVLTNPLRSPGFFIWAV